jgi:hypothetical protein
MMTIAIEVDTDNSDQVGTFIPWVEDPNPLSPETRPSENR